MEQRLSLVTLGVADLERSRRFYEDGLGWQRGNNHEEVVFFQIGGAGAVGTGSLRGMQHLADLAHAGFSIWPFDRPGWPLAVEIYPRLFTPGVVKSRHRARRHRSYAWRKILGLPPGRRGSHAGRVCSPTRLGA
jgi:catechol 2,3-dioxygenase-like lactoylglutathione lyase family enzyme